MTLKNVGNENKPSMGVLHFNNVENKFQLTRIKPSEELAYFVKHYWIIRWDLTDSGPYLQEVVPNPCVNLVFEKNKSAIFGIKLGKSTHLLKGRGIVCGVKFKPGGFYPFYKQPISSLTNSSITLEEVFNVNANHLERQMVTNITDEDLVKQVERFLSTRLPLPDVQVTLINKIIDVIHADREIIKVDNICQKFCMNKRQLQRLFQDYVGVSPKWVIKLYRLQQAAEMIDQENIKNLTELGLDLGYYDQAHFIKDFKSFIGKTPLQYSKSIKK